MAVNKVILGNDTLIDLTADTITPDKLYKGITAHNMKGESIIGTMEGGSTPSVEDNTAVIFADYDGNLIDTWTKDEVASKTSLPTVPEHSGLVFEGWNWTLEDIQTDTTGQVITVGPFYHTESGYSEYDVEVSFQRGMTMTLSTDTGRYSYIDWGDGTIITEATENNPSHTYSQAGNYTIKITLKGVQGRSIPTPDYNIKAVRFGGNNLTWKSPSTKADYVTIPSNMVWNYGENVFSKAKQITAPKDALQSYYIKGNNLEYVAMVKEVETDKAKNSLGCGAKIKYTYIPSSVTSIGNSAFYGCSSLQSITIPENVTSIGNSAFSGCSSLQSITIPENVTSIGSYAFNGCSSLQSITIPSSVTSIGSYAFNGCSSLQSITIPENVTSIENSAFYGCSSLQSITIPENVTSIGNSAFSDCSIYFAEIKSSAEIEYGTYRFNSSVRYDFRNCTSVPVLSSSGGLVSVNSVDFIIVPDNLYDGWIAATNWVAYASKIKKVSEVENTEVVG